MPQYSRAELHALVWAQPMRTVAASIGVSDVALAKACKKADIPFPERGYWARKQAGKPTIEQPLPPRFPGASDNVAVGAGGHTSHWEPNWRENLLREPIPPVPVFDEDVVSLKERVTRLVGKVPCPRQVDGGTAHKLIATLLRRDEERRARGYTWDMPKYETPLKRRWLRILNGLFMGLARVDCRVDMSTSQYGPDYPEISVTVGAQRLAFTLEPLKHLSRGAPAKEPREGLQLSLKARNGQTFYRTWADAENALVESRLAEIIVEMLVTAEVFHRDRAVEHREWVIKRKVEIEEEIRTEKIEAERKERERLAKEAKERIDHLLAQARALSDADTIRKYVNLVRARGPRHGLTTDEIETWASWALAEADRIDPVINGSAVRQRKPQVPRSRPQTPEDNAG